MICQKKDFVIEKQGKTIARVARVSVMEAVNKFLHDIGDTITLFEYGLPIACIKREAIDRRHSVKIMPHRIKATLTEIKDNKNLTDEELEDRLKVLAYDAIITLTKKSTGKEIEHYKKIIKIFAEITDIYEILENRK